MLAISCRCRRRIGSTAIPAQSPPPSAACRQANHPHRAGGDRFDRLRNGFVLPKLRMELVVVNQLQLRTTRLLLRRWRQIDREPFANLNADPVVIEHFPDVLSREESDAMVTGLKLSSMRSVMGSGRLKRRTKTYSSASSVCLCRTSRLISCQRLKSAGGSTVLVGVEVSQRRLHWQHSSTDSVE